MKRSHIHPMPEYFDRYILMADDVEVITALESSLTELENAPVDKWKALQEKVYAPGKWTVKDLLQHIIDTERVFAYRATAFARGDKKVMPFDEDLYAQNAKANTRTIEDLHAEAVCSRKSLISMYQSFDNEMLQKTGVGFKGEYSVLSIGFILAGHQRWHFKVLEERYFPLLD